MRKISLDQNTKPTKKLTFGVKFNPLKISKLIQHYKINVQINIHNQNYH